MRLLFHRLNNQLGIILAHAELLETKAPDEMNRARAAQVVTSALEAMGTIREIRGQPLARAKRKSGTHPNLTPIQPTTSRETVARDRLRDRPPARNTPAGLSPRQ